MRLIASPHTDKKKMCVCVWLLMMKREHPKNWCGIWFLICWRKRTTPVARGNCWLPPFFNLHSHVNKSLGTWENETSSGFETPEYSARVWMVSRVFSFKYMAEKISKKSARRGLISFRTADYSMDTIKTPSIIQRELQFQFIYLIRS